VHVNGKNYGGVLVDVEEEIRDFFCRTSQHWTVGTAKSLVTAVNRGSGVVNEFSVSTSRRICCSLQSPVAARHSSFGSGVTNSNGSTWHRPLLTHMAHVFSYRHGTRRNLTTWHTLSLIDVTQAVSYQHGTHLYLPTWHRQLVTGMAHTFTCRHGTGY
jgi:hypothetical protein